MCLVFAKIRAGKSEIRKIPDIRWISGGGISNFPAQVKETSDPRERVVTVITDRRTNKARTHPVSCLFALFCALFLALKIVFISLTSC